MVERIQREPAFARALLDEAASLFLNGEPATARLILRDLVTPRWALKAWHRLCNTTVLHSLRTTIPGAQHEHHKHPLDR